LKDNGLSEFHFVISKDCILHPIDNIDNRKTIIVSVIRNFISKIYADTATALQYHHLWRFACAILVGILMVKVGWDKETVAIYELIFFAAHLLSFAWSTGVNNALLAYYPTLVEERKKVLLFNAVLLMIFFSVIIAVVFWLFKAPISEFLTDNRELPYTQWIVLFLICSPASILIQAIYLLKNEPRKITNYTHVIFCFQLIFVFISILYFNSVEALVISISLWSLIKFLWLLIVTWKNTSLQFDFNLFKIFAWFSVPLILQFVLSNGMEYVDGIIVNQFFNASDFPVFRYGAKELPITIILVVALSSAMIPLAVENLIDTLKEIKHRTRKLMHILFPLSIALILVSPYLYQWVYSQEYLVSAQLFNIYVLILMTRIILPQVIMYAKQKNAVILSITFVELIINVGLSIFWAQSMGLAGIAYATVVANIVYSLLLVLYTKYKLGVAPKEYIPLKTYGIYLMLLVGAFLLSTQLYSYG